MSARAPETGKARAQTRREIAGWDRVAYPSLDRPASGQFFFLANDSAGGDNETNVAAKYGLAGASLACSGLLNLAATSRSELGN